MGFVSVLIFTFVGMMLTMVIQSSAATFAITLIMCSKGWIDFDLSCALVLGSNIGTTITPLMASMGGNVAAKRTAMGHLLFNFLGTAWTLAIFFPFCHFAQWLTEELGQGDPGPSRHLSTISRPPTLPPTTTCLTTLCPPATR